MKYARFGGALREVLDQLGLKDRNRWFREQVGREDRYLRRWCQGMNLPSSDNWKRFVGALRREKGQISGFEQLLAGLSALLEKERNATRPNKNSNSSSDGTYSFGGELAQDLPAGFLFAEGTAIEPLNVLSIATEWFSRHGGVSTVNRLFCRALAGLGHRVVCVAESPSQEEIESAGKDQVHLVSPQKWPGISAHEALGQPLSLPFGFCPSVIIGHGSHTGPSAKVQKDNWHRDSLRVHFVHVDSGAIEPHKSNVDHGQRADGKVLTDLSLAGTADVVVGLGPRLFKAATDLVLGAQPSPRVIQIDPGFEQGVVRNKIPERQILLITGRMEDAHLKGLDIVASALGLLCNSGRLNNQPVLRVRGAPISDQEALRQFLWEISGHADINVEARPFSTNPILRRQDFLEASLMLMPSREEGFGMAALEAIEECTPVLVSNRSGFADFLNARFPEIASLLVVITPEDRTIAAANWATRIVTVLSNRKAAFETARTIQAHFATNLSWRTSALGLTNAISSIARSTAGPTTSRSVGWDSRKAVQLSAKRLTCCTWSTDEEVIYAAGFDGALYCCDLTLGRKDTLLVGPSIIRVLKCFPGLPGPLVADDRGRLLLVDTKNKAIFELASRTSSIFAVELTSEQNKFLMCDRNGAVSEWQIQTNNRASGGILATSLRILHDHSGPAFAVQWDKWQNRIASVGADGHLRSTDLTTGKKSALKISDHALFGLTIASTHNLTVIGSQNGLINVIDGTQHKSFAGHADAVRTLKLSPLGRWLATGSKDATVRLWDMSSGNAWLLAQAQDYVYEVAFSNSGKHLLAVDGAGILRVFSLPHPIDELTPNDINRIYGRK